MQRSIPSRSERKLERELNRARAVCIYGVQKGTSRQAVGPVAAGRTVASRIAPIATHRVLCLVAQRRVVDVAATTSSSLCMLAVNLLR